jgi:toxin CcdB
MAQFDVYRLPDGPLVVDCQTDFLSYLKSRFVVPLLPPSLVQASARLNPQFEIEGEVLHLFPQGAATVPAADLAVEVRSLASQSYIILNAIDLLVSGV